MNRGDFMPLSFIKRQNTEVWLHIAPTGGRIRIHRAAPGSRNLHARGGPEAHGETCSSFTVSLTLKKNTHEK